MSRSEETDAARPGTVVEEYVKDVRIREIDGEDGEPRYHFKAPLHCGMEFEDREMATLYADVYFEVNGFREEGTGEFGIPPKIVQGGKDTTAAYLLAQPATTKSWVVSFYGASHQEIDRYVRWVRNRAEEIREAVRQEESE